MRRHWGIWDDRAGSRAREEVCSTPASPNYAALWSFCWDWNFRTLFRVKVFSKTLKILRFREVRKRLLCEIVDSERERERERDGVEWSDWLLQSNWDEGPICPSLRASKLLTQHNTVLSHWIFGLSCGISGIGKEKPTCLREYNEPSLLHFVQLNFATLHTKGEHDIFKWCANLRSLNRSLVTR